MAGPLRGTTISVLALSAFLVGAGCGAPAMMAAPSTCSQDPRGLQYLPGMMQAGSGKLLSMKLLASTPGPPIQGTNVWKAELVDTTNHPIDGATIAALPFMPDHGHGTPVKPGVTDMGMGIYQINNLYLFMAGLWQVTLTIKTADGKMDQVVFSFCIEG